jgi:hypothetical protein
MSSKMFSVRLRAFILMPGVLLFAVSSAFGWGSKGHKMINRLAMESLPANMPAFFRRSRSIGEVEYLGPEPDRWRVERDLNSAQAPEHFIDLELADAAALAGLPERRFEFVGDLYKAQAAHSQMAEKFAPEKVGLLPWQANEWFERLAVDMREYRMRTEAHGSTKSVEQAILFDAGILGHYVADGSQPLHTSINYDGWAQQENPEGFSRARGIHGEFETTFVDANVRTGDVRPLVSDSVQVLAHPFQDFLAYLRASHGQVEEVYRLQKQGGFDGAGSAQSRTFTEERLAAGAVMLRDMIYTAWVQSGKGR